MNDTNLQTAVFNKLTKAQYEEKLNNNEINDNEFYMIVDANQMEFSNVESETGVTLKTIKIGNDIWKLPSNQNVSVDLSNYYTKAEVYNKDETYNRDEIDELVGSGSGGGSVGDSITLSKVVSEVIETGSSEDSYFQTQRMRGEGDANSYYHAIEYGYAGNDFIDWFEYGCQWNFWDGTTGQKDKSDDKRCFSIYKDYLMNKGNTFTWPEKSGTFALLSDLEGLGGGGTTDLTGYATETWVEGKGYLTEQSLDTLGVARTADLTGYTTETWVNEQGFAKTADVVTKEDFTEFIGAAPEALNTIHEIAAALEGQDDTITAIETTIGQKANSDDVYTKTEIDWTVATLEGAIQVVEGKIPSGSGGGYDFSNLAPVVGTLQSNGSYKTSQVNLKVPKNNSYWTAGTSMSYDLSEYIANGAKALYVGCARFSNTSTINTYYTNHVGIPAMSDAVACHIHYGWKMIPLNIPFTINEPLAAWQAANNGNYIALLQAKYIPSTKQIDMYVNGFNSSTESSDTNWYAHYFILAVY